MKFLNIIQHGWDWYNSISFVLCYLGTWFSVCAIWIILLNTATYVLLMVIYKLKKMLFCFTLWKNKKSLKLCNRIAGIKLAAIQINAVNFISRDRCLKFKLGPSWNWSQKTNRIVYNNKWQVIPTMIFLVWSPANLSSKSNSDCSGSCNTLYNDMCVSTSSCTLEKNFLFFSFFDVFNKSKHLCRSWLEFWMRGVYTFTATVFRIKQMY